MLAFRDPLSYETVPIRVADGGMIGVGFVLSADAELLSWARVLVIGDLVRRVLEDIHSAQVAAVAITTARRAADGLLACDLMVRPVAGVFTTRADAEAYLRRPLELMIAAAGSHVEQAPWPPTIWVAPVHSGQPYPAPDPAAARLALASLDYAQPIELTDGVIADTHALLQRWRGRLNQWSRHPSHPIPPAWRTAVIAALDDDLDVARALTMMAELEDDESIEPGAKFEAFTYLDRVLAVDLSRDLGTMR